jgi:uncharacterized protein (TIGR00730 family)
MQFTSVAVFCASAMGLRSEYALSARTCGSFLAERNCQIVYGGGKVGLMGELADAALKAGGRVTGIIPSFMIDRELAHKGLGELVIVDSMHSRKLQMHERSEAVIALPGGYGTFEELFEILTWIQLGLYRKPVGILNVAGYYNHLELQLDHMCSEGLLKSAHRNFLLFDTQIEPLFERMSKAEIPEPIFTISGKET